MKNTFSFNPASDVSDYPFESETILFKESSQDFCRLNETASLIWHLFREGLSRLEIISLLNKEYGTEPSVAQSYTDALLEDLIRQRFINDETSVATDAQADQPQPKPPTTHDQPKLAHETHFHVGGLVFNIFSDDSRCIELLNTAFGFMRPAQEATEPVKQIDVWIHEAPDQFYTIHVNHETHKNYAPDEIPPAIHAIFITSYYDTYFSFLAFHSAAVEKDGNVILIPGESGSGKSTLTASLSEADFNYITDELTLIDLHTDTLKGAPLAIGLKQGSWQLLRAFSATIDGLPCFKRQDKQIIKYYPPRNVSSTYSLSKTRCIIFPTITSADTPASLTPIDVPDTFFRLTQAGYDTRRHLTTQDIELIFTWLKSVTCYQLKYRSLDKAIELISHIDLT